MKMRPSLLPSVLFASVCLALAANAQQDSAPGAPPEPPAAPEAPVAASAPEPARVPAQAWAENIGPMAYSYSFGHPDRNEHSLVIRSSETDAKTLAADEEDLNIMGHILEKAIANAGESEDHRAMGITVFSSPGSSGLKNFDIEGFGAMFLLNVNFPLTGPERKSDDDAGKEAGNSTWDEARREVYGSPAGSGQYFFGRQPGHAMDYDPKQVDRLKDSLLEALKNAGNMRNLKPDEGVELVVRSNDEGAWDGGQVLQQRLNSIARHATASPFDPTDGSGGGGSSSATVSVTGGGGTGGGGSGGRGGSTGGAGELIWHQGTKILREGDVVKFTFPAATNLNCTTSIQRDGNMKLPFATVKAAGKTPDELQESISKLYIEKTKRTEFPVELMWAVPARKSRSSFATTLHKTGGGGGAVLTIRARKTDIDAFAKGKLSFDEFKSKAVMLIY